MQRWLQILKTCSNINDVTDDPRSDSSCKAVSQLCPSPPILAEYVSWRGQCKERLSRLFLTARQLTMVGDTNATIRPGLEEGRTLVRDKNQSKLSQSFKLMNPKLFYFGRNSKSLKIYHVVISSSEEKCEKL